MTKYSTEIVNVPVGLIGNFDKNLVKRLQPILDKGSKEGKKLHSIQFIQAISSKHMTYLVVWESTTETTESKTVKSKTVKSKAVKSKAVKSKAVKSKPTESKTTKSKAVKKK